MARFTGTITDQNGVPQAGARVLVQASGDGSLANLTDDLGGFIPNPITTSPLGSFAFNVDPGLYDLTYQAAKGGRIIRQLFGVQIGSPQIDPNVNAAIASAVATSQAATSAQIGALTTTNIAEGSRLYFTPARAQAAISGSSTATVTNGVVSITATNAQAIFGAPIITALGGTVSGPLLVTSTSADPNAVATISYVQSIAAGQLPRSNSVAATTGNITLSGTQTIDGVAVTAGQIVLVKNQTAASQNGLYVVAAGAWARSSDMDTWAEVPGATTTVLGGTVNANSTFTCNSPAGGTLNTTAINFVVTNRPGNYDATGGVTKTGTTFSLTPGVAALLSGAAFTGGTSSPYHAVLSSGNGRIAFSPGSSTATGVMQLQDSTGATLGQINQGSGALRITTFNGDQIWANGGRIWDDLSIVAGKDLTLTPPTGSAVTATTPGIEDAQYGIGRQFAQFNFYNPRVNYSLTASYGATNGAVIGIVSKVGGTSYGAGGMVYTPISVETHYDTPSPNSVNSNLEGVSSRMVFSVDGGTASGQQMNFVPIHSYLGGKLGAKNGVMTGFELDIGLNSTQAEATNLTRWGIFIGSMGSPKGAQGGDAAVFITGLPQYKFGYQQNDGGKSGWRDGILIAPSNPSDLDYTAPVDANGYLIRATGGFPAAGGIDISGATFSNFAFRSANFLVNAGLIQQSATNGQLNLGNPTGANTPGIEFFTQPGARGARIEALGGSGSADTGLIQARCDTFVLAGGSHRPAAPNVGSIGQASFPWAAGYFQTAPIITSDARVKTDLHLIEDKWDAFVMGLKTYHGVYKPTEIAAKYETRKVSRQKTVPGVRTEVVVEDGPDGQPVAVAREVPYDRPLTQEIPVLDPVTMEPLMRQAPTGEYEDVPAGKGKTTRRQLQAPVPLTYTVPVMEEVEETVEVCPAVSQSYQRRHFWFLAQEVRALITACGLDADGDTETSSVWALFAYNAEADRFMLRMEEFIPLLTWSLQRLAKRVAMLEKAS